MGRPRKGILPIRALKRIRGEIRRIRQSAMGEEEKQTMIDALQKKLEPDTQKATPPTQAQSDYVQQVDRELEGLLMRMRAEEALTVTPATSTPSCAASRSDVVKCPNCGWQFHAGETAR
jgi:hypothetical protein